MPFPDPAAVDFLKRAWTDALVRVLPGHPGYARFEGKVGRVVTVNQAGRALVDFADGAWYDLPASADCLAVVPPDEVAGLYDPTANSAQKLPPRQG